MTAVANTVTSGRRRGERHPGTAEGGVFFPSLRPVIPEIHPLNRSTAPRDGLRLDDPQQLLSDAERGAYGHLTGLLLDTNISGLIRNEYLYLSSSLIGEILSGDGSVYDFTISDTFISFTSRATTEGGHAEGFLETDGEPLESSEIGKLFHRIRQEVNLKESWRASSGLDVSTDITFGAVDVTHEGMGQLVSLPVETRFGEWAIELQGFAGGETLTYSLRDLDRDVTMTRRTADAILSDIAEGCGKAPDPAEVLEAMLRVAVAASQRNAIC
ncbi:MAG TPA: hypothetical protein VF885_05375 [Arthrobacter sp.]